MQLTTQTPKVIFSVIIGFFAGILNEDVLIFSTLMLLVFYASGWGWADWEDIKAVLTGNITEIDILLRMIPVFILSLIWLGLYLFKAINFGLKTYKRLSM
ncbi:hypothetical protein ISS06_00875 [Patescibacteria group bacterium]|nr:hypothetical protein [Patescibacteria group bacterium]